MQSSPFYRNRRALKLLAEELFQLVLFYYADDWAAINCFYKNDKFIVSSSVRNCRDLMKDQNDGILFFKKRVFTADKI